MKHLPSHCLIVSWFVITFGFAQTNNLEYKVQAIETGYSCKEYAFNPTHLIKIDKWKGEWIWHSDQKIAQTSSEWINGRKGTKINRVLFRKTFTLNDLRNKLYLSLTADVSYRVYINGGYVANGPANIGSDYEDSFKPLHWFYSTYEVSRYLRLGSNLIAVEVFTSAFNISETTSGTAGLICDLRTANNDPILSTDDTWRCAVDSSYMAVGDRITIDATTEPTYWNKTTFDDSNWQNSQLISKPKEGFLQSNKLPDCIRHVVEPEHIMFKQTEAGESTAITKLIGVLKNGEYQIQYPQLITAKIAFSVMAHKGDTLEIVPYEKLSTKPNRVFNYICHEGLNQFETPFLIPFKYLKLKTSNLHLPKLESFDAILTTYPLTYKGEFDCSNPFYSDLWKIARWSTQLCMNDMFFDSPKHQEPLACTGDYLIESISNYYAFGDQWLTRQDIEKTARILEKKSYDFFHTSYSLLWVQMLSNFNNHFNDTALLVEMVPHVNKLLATFKGYLGEDFLLTEAPDYMFMDWIKIDEFNAHHPPAVIGTGYLTAFYYKALLDASALNTLVANNDIALEQLELANRIKESINTNLWDASKQIYKDGIAFKTKTPAHFWRPGDKDIVTYSPHFNSLCVLYDIAPPNVQINLIDYVVNQKEIEIQPYFLFFVFDAVNHVGLFDKYGFMLLNKWEYGYDKETLTLVENWSERTSFGYVGDYSHAWGGSPLSVLSGTVLGLKPIPLMPETLSFKPLFTTKLEWARGKVPYKNSTIEIAWERLNTTYSYALSVPANCKLILDSSLFPSSYAIIVNNEVARTEKLILTTGKHQIVLKER